MNSSDPSATFAAAAPKPLVKHVALRWSGEGLCFEGGPEGVPSSVVDGGSKAGPSPTDHLLLAFAGCMGADVLDILNKSRVPIGQLEVDVVGTRAPTPPRRFVTIKMVFRLSGPSETDRPKVERALNLSRETYCSVLHSLRPDLELSFEIRVD
jgi:putative redox protein